MYGYVTIFHFQISLFAQEEQELQLELEKLERSRNIHIREIKRVHNEDLSRFVLISFIFNC